MENDIMNVTNKDEKPENADDHLSRLLSELNDENLNKMLVMFLITANQ